MLITLLGSAGAGAQVPIYSVCMASIIGAFYLPLSLMTPALAKWCAAFAALGANAAIAHVLKSGGAATVAERALLGLRSQAFDGFMRQARLGELGPGAAGQARHYEADARPGSRLHARPDHRPPFPCTYARAVPGTTRPSARPRP